MIRPTAFVLLATIAERARRTDSTIGGLTAGEALVGDYKSYGVSRQNYRSDLKFLEKSKILTIKVTNKGTIAKLIDDSIFDINIDEGNQQTNHQVTINQPSSNHQVTTNNNVKKDKNDKKTTLKQSSTSKQILMRDQTASVVMELSKVYVNLKQYEARKLIKDFGYDQVVGFISNATWYWSQRTGKNQYRIRKNRFIEKIEHFSTRENAQARIDEETRWELEATEKGGNGKVAKSSKDPVTSGDTSISFEDLPDDEKRSRLVKYISKIDSAGGPEKVDGPTRQRYDRAVSRLSELEVL